MYRCLFKFITVALIFLSPIAKAEGYKQLKLFYETPTKVLTVVEHCAEGNVGCKNVDLVIKNKKTGVKEKKYQGETINQSISHNKLGYVFKTKSKDIYIEDRRGYFSVYEKNKFGKKKLVEEEKVALKL